jgi:hypothetical protein
VSRGTALLAGLLLASCTRNVPPPVRSDSPTIVDHSWDNKRETKSAQPQPKPADEARNNFDLALALDLKLSELLAQRRIVSADFVAVQGRRTWPEKVRSLWSRVVIYLDDALRRPPGDFPVPLIVRTRVGIDTELDATIAQHGPAPKELAAALKDVLALLTKHLHSPNSPQLEIPGPELKLVWPLSTPMITSKFGNRVDPITEGDVSRFHAGIDLGGSTGDVVLAAAPGRVTYAGWLEGRGNTVVVHHGGGFVTLYAHLSELLVEPGARVAPNTPVGLVGSSGRATGPHLHFEVRKRGVPVDPEPLLPNQTPTAAIRP